MFERRIEAERVIPLVAFLVVAAEITTIFSYLMVLVFGLIVTVYKLKLLCTEIEKSSLVRGGILAWLVAIAQIVSAVLINEDTVSFCNEDSGFGLEDSAICSGTLYRVMNATGGILWLLAGLLAMKSPNPRSRKDSYEDNKSVDSGAASDEFDNSFAEGKSITTEETTNDSDESEREREREIVEDMDDLKV